MSELPQDLQEIEERLDRSDREARTLIADLDEERFNWRPDARSWSVAQCLDHLNAANRAYLDAMEKAVEQARHRGASRRGPIQPRALERWFIGLLAPPARRRLPAPRKIVPAAQRSRAEVREEWERVQARIRNLLGEAAPLDLNEARFVNPFFSLIRFSVGTGFLVIDAHERRHLLQAARVLERCPAGFSHETSPPGPLSSEAGEGERR